MELILHIARRGDVTDEDGGLYRAASLDSEGFIHCSTVSQVLRPADRLFRGQEDLVLLCIDCSSVPHPIVYEDCYGHGEVYPHIYGPLPWSAVRRVVPFPPGPDGRFSLPQELQHLRALHPPAAAESTS